MEEAMLWKNLKNKQLEGRRFRRQFSVNNYILDFYCPSEKLALEIDGEGHYTVEGKNKDAVRDKNLQSIGIKVLRFENVKIRVAMDYVLEKIKYHFHPPPK